MRLWTLVALGLVALLGPATGCSDPVVPADGGGLDTLLPTDVGGGEMPPAPTGCRACVLDLCATERAACLADGDCAGQVDGMEACVPADNQLAAADCPATSCDLTNPVTRAYSDCLLGNQVKCEDCSCGGCLATECGTEVAGYRGSAAGQALIDCSAACPTCDDATAFYSCVDDCDQANEAGFLAYVPLNGCVQTRCRTACGGPSACTDCIFAQCPQQADCERDPDCRSYQTCFFGCDTGDEDCADACAEREPDGFELFQQIAPCVSTRCNAECIES